MNIKQFSLFVWVGLLCHSSVFAATNVLKFSAEPYAGYGLLGGTSVSGNNVTADTGNLTGFGFGARGAAHFAEMFFAGVDASFYPSFSYSPPSGATVTNMADSGTKSLKLGVVAGVALPVLPLRFWLGWNIMDRLSDTNSAGSDATLKGMSFKVGAGYKVIPLLSLNAEYIMASYGSADVTTNGVTTTTTSSNYSFSHKILFLSASVPFEF